MPRDMVNVRRPSGAGRYQAPKMRLGRSQFDLTHSHKTTFDASKLIPYFVAEVIPGDTFTCKLTALVRIFSPLDAPVMDDIEADIHFFFVPNRLVWTNWTAFLGEHDEAGAQDTDYTIPLVSTSSASPTVGSIAHYFGIPLTLNFSTEDVSALPFRAYVLIYNEWFRDQNLINEYPVVVADSAGYATGLGPTSACLNSGKKHDYFTSALPYLQKGTAQEIPLTDPDVYTLATTTQNISVEVGQGSGVYSWLDADAAHADISGTDGSAATGMYADLQSIGLTINALREAAAIQRLLERDARGGTRHPELIRAHFGVDVPDYRTQRPEYLGGGRGFINVSPVANTSDINAATAAGGANVYQGELRGIGVGTLQASWAKSFVEHGHVIGILRARGQLSYHQGLERMWSRSTKYDFLWPELAQLGEQPIYNKELWIEGDATDDAVFGYQERYADYRFKKSLITGKFASDAPGTLDFWHVAEDFGAQPALNQTFIEDATPMVRITTVDTEPDFIIDGRFDLRVARALPVRPVPTLMPARY